MRWIAMILVLACSTQAHAAKTLEQHAVQAAAKSYKVAKVAAKLIKKKRNGYVRVRNRKKMKKACKALDVRVAVHMEAYKINLESAQTMAKGGRLGMIMARRFMKLAGFHLGTAQGLMPTHVRCLAAKKWARVYIDVAVRGSALTLTAKRWTRRDRIRIRRALKPHAKKLRIKSAKMVDTSGSTRGTHRF